MSVALADSDSGPAVRRVILSCRAWNDFRQSKIENLRVAALGNENIRRLDVAVNDAFRVRRVERVGDFNRQIQEQAPFPAACRRCDASASRLPETPWR